MRRHLFNTAVLAGVVTAAGLAAGLLAPWGRGADEPPPAGVVATLQGRTDAVYAIASTPAATPSRPDGKQVLPGSFDRTLKLWDAATGKEVKTFGGPQGHQNLVLALAVSPDGQSLASGASDNTAKVWDIPSASHLREFAGT